MKMKPTPVYYCLLFAALAAPNAGLAANSTLFMQATPCDDGTLPRITSCSGNSYVLYNSPDLWVQNTAIPGYQPYPYQSASPPPWLTAAVQVNQAPMYSDPLKSQPIYVYVRVHNPTTGTATTGTEQLHVYWSVASAGLSWPVNFVDYMDNICDPSAPKWVYGMEITKPRQNITTASSTDVQNYLHAIQSLATSPIGSYNYWFLQNQVHTYAFYYSLLYGCNPVNGNSPEPACLFSAHWSDGFPAWHREFLSRYETLLRQFDPTVTLMYWDWTTDPRTTFNSTITSVIGGFSGSIGTPWDTSGMLGFIPGGVPSCGFSPSCVIRNVTGSPETTPDSTIYNQKSYSEFASWDEGRALLSSTPPSHDPSDQAHNTSHPFIGGSGNMSDLSYAAQDPFFFLLHGNVDKLWAEWQRNPATVSPSGFGSGYDPSTVTSANTATPVAVAYTGTQNVMNGAMAPWNGYEANGSSGTKPPTPLHPFAINSSGNDPYVSSKTANDHSIVFPPPYDVAPVTIPPLAPGESVVIEIPWYPPNPAKYSGCVNNNQLHVCLVARVTTSSAYPYGMDSGEGTDLDANVYYNNRVAWHNEEVIDPPGPLLGGSVLVRNVLTNTTSTGLSLTLSPSNAALLSYGRVILDLGNLYANWQTNGSVATGFTNYVGTQLELTSTNGFLSNIVLGANEADAVQVLLLLNDGYPHPQGQTFAVNFSEYNQGVSNQLVGGQIFTFDFNQLTLVPKGSTWFYTNQYQGSNWNQVGYADTNWLSGPALLGYGLGDETTVINSASNSAAYFRYDFTLQDVGLYSNLWVQLRAYDGAVVYLNGTEIYRRGMPAGTVSPSSPAVGDITGVAIETFFATNVSGFLSLLSSNNVLAVEVHQATNSTDLGFDGALIANIADGSAGASNFPPQVTFLQSTNTGMYLPGQTIQAVVDAVDPLYSISSVSFYGDGQFISTATSPPYTVAWNGVPVGEHQITAVAANTLGVTGNGYSTVLVMSNLPPTVVINTPLNGQTFASNSVISFNASAMENGGAISKVDFYYVQHGPAINNPQVLIGTAASPPYTVPLTGLPPATYLLTAVATDTYGVRSYSVPVHIVVCVKPTLTISYAAPFVTITWTPTNGVLQQAPLLTGPWQSLTNVTTPYGFVPNPTNRSMFFRVSVNTNLLCTPQ
jgi:hypothetical protein